MATRYLAGIIFANNPNDGDVLSFNVGTDTVTLTARTVATGILDFEIGDIDNGTNINCRDALIRDYNDIVAVRMAGTRAVSVRALEYDDAIVANPTNQIEMAVGFKTINTSQLDFWFQQVGLPEDVSFQWDVDLASGTSTAYDKITKWTLQDPLVADEFYAGSSFQAAAQGLKSNLDTFNLGEGFAVTVETWTNKAVVSLSADEEGTQFNNISIGDVGATFNFVNIGAPPSLPTGERFFYKFTSFNEDKYTVTVYDDEYLGEPVEMIGAVSPFIIDYPKYDTFKTLRGSGATLSFIYDGEEAFMRDMFNTNLTKFPVFLTKLDDAAPEGKVVVWSGFLNSELYEEEFSDDGVALGIQYELTANDGLSTLKEKPLFNERSNDLVTPYDVVTQSLDKILYFDDNNPISYFLYVYEDYELDDYVYQEVFENLYMNTSNFIDEDFVYKEASFCLQTTLEPFRLSLIKVGNSFYVLPLSAKASNNDLTCRTFRKSYGGEWQYLLDTTISVASNSVGLGDYYETGQSLSYNTGISSQRISVDNYSKRDIFPNDLTDEGRFESKLGDQHMGASVDWEWDMTTYAAHSDFTFSTVGDTYASPVVVRTGSQHKQSPNEDLPVAMISNPYKVDIFQSGHIDGLANGLGMVITSKKLIPRTMASNPSKMLLNLNLMFMNNIDNYLKGGGIYRRYPGFEIGCMLKVGDYYLASTHYDETLNRDQTKYFFKKTLYWTTTPSTFAVCVSKPLSEQVGQSNYWDLWLNTYNYGKSQLLSDIDDRNNIYSNLSEALEIRVPPSLQVSWNSQHPLSPIEVEFGISNYVAVRWYQYNYDGASRGMFWRHITGYDPSDYRVDAIMVKDLTIEFASDTNENSKVEFEVENDIGFRDEGADIELNIGTSNRVDALQRGGLFARHRPVVGNPDSYYIPMTEDEDFGGTIPNAGKFLLNSNSEYKSIEELLIDTVVANKFKHTTSISANLKWPQYTPLSFLNFETLNGRKMEFCGGSIDVWEGSIRGLWNEIIEE